MWNKIQRIYVGDHYQVYPKWKPWANTIAYYKLESDANDYSWNSKNMSNSWVTFNEYSWVNCWYFNGSWYLSRSWSLFTWSSDFTVSAWIKPDWNWVSGKGRVIYTNGTASWTRIFTMWLKPISTWNLMVWWWSNDRDTSYIPAVNSWTHCVMAHSWWTIKVYCNWSLIYTGSVSFNISNNISSIWRQVNGSDYFYWYLSNIIIENNQRTAQEVADYYNQTKWNYGL